MRKILLIPNEKYLDRALQDVGGLMTFEQQHLGKEKQVDLLAVILLPAEAMARVTLEHQTCDLFGVTGRATPFECDSVSMNGVWLLLTVSQLNLPHHVSRQESLSRVLSALRSNGCVQTGVSIFPVFPPEEDEESVTEEMEFLRDEHPGLPILQPLSMRSREYSVNTSNARFISHVQ